MTQTDWAGCYDDGWQGLIVPEAFVHPAKMARGLLERIITRLYELGVPKGALVLDPFGGIGTTAVIGTGRGLRVICCELEPKFVALARANIEMHRRDWEAMDRVLPVIVEGDSRNLRAIINEALAVDAVWDERYRPAALIASPPYAEIATGAGGLNTKPAQHAGQQSGRSASSASQDTDQRYGQTDGQLARLSLGEVDAVVASPPWGQNSEGGLRGSKFQTPEALLQAKRGHGASDAAILRKLERDEAREYGNSPGQLGEMPLSTVDAVISSPPYWQDRTHSENQPGIAPCVRAKLSKADLADRRYGQSAGQLGEMPSGGVEAVVSSPPYTEALLHGRPSKMTEGIFEGRTAVTGLGAYGDNTDGQLGAMDAGSVDAVVSSPPFTQGYSGGGGINVKGYGDGTDKVGDRTYQGTGAEREPGNLESLTLGAVDAVVGSPPWEQSADASRTCNEVGTRARQATSERGEYAPKYGTTEGQLGAMDAVVTSPPYEASVNSQQAGIDWTRAAEDRDGPGQNSQGTVPFAYGKTDGQMGREQGETFWSAAQAVVRETYALLKPGGYAVWVVKAFVRDKQLVDFPGDWRRLCEHAGFVTIEEIHASLVEEEVHGHLFDGTSVKRRERKSFFRRLAEKKGSPRIDWETVYIMRKQ